MGDVNFFLIVTIPVMVLLGVRHALDVDHITAIDNLVRLHNAVKRARWVGSAFSAGHMLSVCLQMVAIIYVVKSLEAGDHLQLWGGIVGAVALGGIGAANLYSMRRYGKTGSAMLAERIAGGLANVGPIGSSSVTGMIFGLGFDTATQISALTVSAVASATQGLQVALVLAGAFAVGMIATDSLDSLFLQAVFSRIIGTKGFRAISYALSGIALSIALAESYSLIMREQILPDWTGPGLAAAVLVTAFGYAKYRRQRLEPIESPSMP